MSQENKKELIECNICKVVTSKNNIIHAKSDSSFVIIMRSSKDTEYFESVDMKPCCIPCLSDEKILVQEIYTIYGPFEYTGGRAYWPKFKEYFELVIGKQRDVIGKLCDDILLSSFNSIICDYLINAQYYKDDD